MQPLTIHDGVELKRKILKKRKEVKIPILGCKVKSICHIGPVWFELMKNSLCK